MPGQRQIMLVLLALAWIACRPDESTAPKPELDGGPPIEPKCQLGCVEIDPFPTKPGVFLGSGVTPLECFDGGHTDGDVDGLSDFCERELAFAFTPELAYWHIDNVAREPYWTVRPLGGMESPIRIAYLLGYYRDEGSDVYGCSLPFAPPSCHGHLGDSEVLAFDVYYVASTQHWVLHTAWLSEHGDFVDVPKTSKPYPHLLALPPLRTYTVEYATHLGAHMRVYVAQGKHANYVSREHCNDGGTFQTDTCVEVDTYTRDNLSVLWNVGSRSHPFLTCVLARSPAHEWYGSGREECFWSTTTRFRGWYPTFIGGDDSSPYNDALVYLGF